MNAMPSQVRDFLSKLLLRNRPMAYLKADLSGHLLESGGELDTFGVGALSPDQPLDQQVFYLAGLLPVSEHRVSYTCVEIDEAVMEIHLFRENEADWILLLAASDETQLKRTLLQALNQPHNPTTGTGT